MTFQEWFLTTLTIVFGLAFAILIMGIIGSRMGKFMKIDDDEFTGEQEEK